jgi:hypothetical protein
MSSLCHLATSSADKVHRHPAIQGHPPPLDGHVMNEYFAIPGKRKCTVPLQTILAFQQPLLESTVGKLKLPRVFLIEILGIIKSDHDPFTNPATIWRIIAS